MVDEMSFDPLDHLQNDILDPYSDTIAFPSYIAAQEEENEFLNDCPERVHSEFASPNLLYSSNVLQQQHTAITEEKGPHEQDDIQYQFQYDQGIIENKVDHPPVSYCPESPPDMIEELLNAHLEHRQHMGQQEEDQHETIMTNLRNDQDDDPFLHVLFSTVSMHQLQSAIRSKEKGEEGEKKNGNAKGMKSVQVDLPVVPPSVKSLPSTAVTASSSTSSKKNTIVGVDASLVDPSRVWQNVSGSGKMTVMMKTRLDEPSSMLPVRLYSSLKYELHVTVPKSQSILHVKCFMVDSESLKEVKSVNVLKGTTEAAMTKSASGDKFQGILKVQISNDMSHHKNGKKYRLEVRLFLPSDLNNAIMISRSPEFKVFARRPNKPKHLRKKRKIENVSNEGDDEADADTSMSTTAVARKKHKKQPYSDLDEPQLSLFSVKLDELFDTVNQLGNNARKKAVQLMITRCFDMGLPSQPTDD